MGIQAPFVGIARTPDGHGYWVPTTSATSTLGDATQLGQLSSPGSMIAPVVGIAATPKSIGYWLVGVDGGVFSFGSARFYGSMGAAPPSNRTPVIAMASTLHGGGYWLATSDKQLPPPAPVPSVLAHCDYPSPTPSVRPSTIILACGDGNALLTNLSWSSWTPTVATATGYFTHNTCTPDCAQGRFVSTPASVRLSYPIQTSAGREIATIGYTTPDPSAPGGYLTETSVGPTSPG